MKYEEFLSTLTEEEMIQLVVDYEQFEKDGFIGECLLREKSKQYESMLGINTHTVANMRDIAMSCYKHFAKKYFEITGTK